MNKTLFLIDGYGLLFRAYFSNGCSSVQSPCGLEVNAVYRFMKKLDDLVDTVMTNTTPHVVVALDTRQKNFRHELYPEYKQNRPPCPEDLVPQFTLVRQAIDAIGWRRVEKGGYEADDLIASYVHTAKKQGYESVIISSDKDLMQLIDQKTSMYADRYIDDKGVEEKWGVTPKQMVDFLSLMGDASDNIPGVPGIGAKTAAKLLQEYGDLENILSHASDIKQKKRREYLMQHKESARLAKKLVQLRTDVPLQYPIESLATNNNIQMRPEYWRFKDRYQI